MSLLESIRGPKDLKALEAGRLDELASDIRQFLVSAVARTGGHLGVAQIDPVQAGREGSGHG